MLIIRKINKILFYLNTINFVVLAYMLKSKNTFKNISFLTFFAQKKRKRQKKVSKNNVVIHKELAKKTTKND